MKVLYNNYKCNDRLFTDLSVGATFVTKFKFGTVTLTEPETASVYIKLACTDGHNCINLNTGAFGYLVDKTVVYPVEAELRWNYEES